MIRNNQVNKNGFTVIELLVVITIIALLVIIFISYYHILKIPGDTKQIECQDNLRKLYYGLVTYNAEFKLYPCGDSYRGTKFWEALRTEPTPDTAVLREKNRDELYICPIRGGFGAVGICHYRGPNFDVSNALKETDPIGADMAQNHDDPKHGRNPINVLYWGGKVLEIKYNTPEWQQADSSLQE